MNAEIISHIFIMLFGVMIASIAQVLLKSSAMSAHGGKIKEYLNRKVLLAYGMMLGSTLCTVWAYRVISISMGMVLDATGYVYVTIFGYFFFKEKVTGQRLFALLLIMTGIAFYAFRG